MAHLNIYVPDELAAELKSKAAKEGVSLSKFVVGKLEDKPSKDWGDFFEKRCGWLTWDFEEPEDPPPEPPDWEIE